jgi:hypothetical protein
VIVGMIVLESAAKRAAKLLSVSLGSHQLPRWDLAARVDRPDEDRAPPPRRAK